MASSSFSNSASRWTYDVFLSFRGEDTRKSFTDHLYNALVRAGINTFRDDDELKIGEEIGPELVKAISESRFSIIVFSKSYASSTWCLDELVHILACRKTLGHAVFPVFHNIDPSDVRKQKNSFAEAFKEHEKKFDMDKVKRWRDALREVANLKGLDLRNHADGHESENIDSIVKEISDRLDRPKLSVAIHPVGLRSRANEVISLLSDESCEASIVGIYGMGGIGKTTIAKQVYNKIFHKFEGSCFLTNVRENSDPKGIVQLQRQLLSETLMRKHEKIYNVDRGLNVIQERLCRKRVLVVLDDVDEVDQVHKILGNRCWLFPGSRIVITTRIENLLKPSRLYRQYKVKELDDNESLQLLSLHAFDICYPIKKYLECAESVVGYVRGNPLALEVLGSSLSDQDVDIWIKSLEKLKVIGNQKINMVLEISYNSLDDAEKFLFLDIACFFIGKDKNYVMSILDGCGFFPTVGINNLIKRCLLSIDSKNKLMMHDLLRDMGRDIVRRESSGEPGNRSRLWRHEDVIDVLTDKSGTKAVEGLILNLQAQCQKFSTKAFKKMTRLRLLQLNYVCLIGSFEKFSTKLRWLCWHAFPLDSMPDDLHLGYLVALDMRYSKLEQFPEEEAFQARKLKFLNLSHSHVLTKISNFEGFPNLEILKLKDCVSLVELDESIGNLTKLLFLNLQDCKNLRNLPESICTLRSVKNLNISGCSKLEDLPEDLGHMKSLVELVADRTSISQLPATFGNLSNLRVLSFCECPLMPSPREGPSIISVLPVLLEKLDLRHCNLPDDMLPRDLHVLSRLKELKLCGNNFSSLPASIGSLTNLVTLWLNNCKRLKSVPKLSYSIRSLQADDCPSLEIIDLTQSQPHPNLEVHGCPKLKVLMGFFNLEPIEVETVEKLLGTPGLLTRESIASVQVHMLNNLTRTATIGPLQALSEKGMYSIFLPFKEIPSWFKYQNEGDTISLHVPPLGQGHNIIGFIICAVYAWEKCHESCYFFPHITVTNRSKMFDWLYVPKVTFFQREVEHDIMWLSYWMFNHNLLSDEQDMSWRFGVEMQTGDHIYVSIDLGFGISVKKCGVHLLYSQSSQSDEVAMISWASSRHHRRFTQSHHQWFKFNQQRVIASSGMNQDQEADFQRWSKRRTERVDQVGAYTANPRM